MTIKAKVVFREEKPYKIIKSTPSIKPEVILPRSEDRQVPTLHTTPFLPEQLSILEDLDDVGVLEALTGAVLLWNTTEEKFILQTYDPNLYETPSLDGGTF